MSYSHPSANPPSPMHKSPSSGVRKVPAKRVGPEDAREKKEQITKLVDCLFEQCTNAEEEKEAAQDERQRLLSEKTGFASRDDENRKEHDAAPLPEGILLDPEAMKSAMQEGTGVFANCATFLTASDGGVTVTYPASVDIAKRKEDNGLLKAATLQPGLNSSATVVDTTFATQHLKGCPVKVLSKDEGMTCARATAMHTGQANPYDKGSPSYTTRFNEIIVLTTKRPLGMTRQQNEDNNKKLKGEK